MSLKTAIERELGIPVRLRMGGPGALDIFLDREQIYSKKKTGHMPIVQEIVDTIRSKTVHE